MFLAIGLDLNNAALFRPPPVNPNGNILRPQAGPSSSMSSRPIASPAPQQHVKLKSDPSRRDIPSNRHSTPSSNHSHRSSVEVKSEHIASRRRQEFLTLLNIFYCEWLETGDQPVTEFHV